MSVFKDEQGMTSAGMAVALLVTLALLFSSVQAYAVNSKSAAIQEVADAAALAAENEVAEFMIAVNVCDATVLSMTLLGATVFGIGVVTACIPPLAIVSESLISTGTKIVQARDRFSESAAKGLDALQKTLPFLAAASAEGIAKANSNGTDEDYLALGLLVPSTGAPIATAIDDSLATLDAESSGSAKGIREAAGEAEKAAEKAQAAKLEAYSADCGNAPGRCLYERAASLSEISDSANPMYSNVDAWTFGVVQSRALEYYRVRISEPEPSGSVAEKASYHLRNRFYRYVYSLLVAARSQSGLEEGSCIFPKIFRNTREFKETELYAEAIYAVSEGDALNVIHAYDGCPSVESIIGRGSIAGLDTGVYAGCETCGFEVESMGNIASATTNVPTGFEHHYEKIRVAAEQYKEEMEAVERNKAEVQNLTAPIFDLIEEVLGSVGGQRIKADPPGSAGCIAVARNAATVDTSSFFSNLFVEGGTVYSGTTAVSAATLIEDSSHDDASVITSLLDGFGQEAGAAVGAGRIVLDLWSGLLKAYENGQSALADALSDGLGSVQNSTLSGLGKWAASKLTGLIEAAGLESAQLKALKPVTLNTGIVASAQDSPFTVVYTQVKGSALSASSPSPDVITGIFSNVSLSVAEIMDEATFTIAEIEFPIGDISIPITLALPEGLKRMASGGIEGLLGSISSSFNPFFNGRVWQ